MTTEMIEKFVETKSRNGSAVKIFFKERSTISGVFIQGKDYQELKSKNFWRIVNNASFAEWKKSESSDLVRIYNGTMFSKLADEK